MESDAEIVASILDGQPDAFALLVRRYERAVRAVATQVLGDLHAAEDAAQEAFIMAYENLVKLRDRSAFGAWLLKIARRKALTVARRGRHATNPLPSDQEAVQSINTTLSQRSQNLLDAVMGLPEHERRVIMLKYFDGYGVNAIADMTGLAVGTVTKKLSRARQRLRTRMEVSET